MYLPGLAIYLLGVRPAQGSWQEPKNKPHVFLWRRQQWPLIVIWFSAGILNHVYVSSRKSVISMASRCPSELKSCSIKLQAIL